VRADVLEREFAGLVGRLQLREEYLRLFAAVVRDAWDARQALSKAQVASALSKMEELKSRRNKLIDALVDGAISREAYQNRLDTLEVDLAVASGSAQDAVVENLEIDALITYAQRFLGVYAVCGRMRALKIGCGSNRSLFPKV
jgi:hypothetical protein